LKADLVIFDCDGVLVDSEPIANRVMARLLAGLGLPMSEADVVKTFIGLSRDACIELIEQKLGRRLPPSFAEDWDASLFEALRKEVKAVRGVAQLLRALRTPFCVASNGTVGRMRATLGTTGLLPFFEGRMFSSMEVARPKPAPDLFLHAARSMGARPAHCIVVEDTPAGVQAAVSAGMKALAYAGGPYADPAALASAGGKIFSDMESLQALLLIDS
jgi:HAD superfamily hydrolase (TIGR01509 family)